MNGPTSPVPTGLRDAGTRVLIIGGSPGGPGGSPDGQRSLGSVGGPGTAAAVIEHSVAALANELTGRCGLAPAALTVVAQTSGPADVRRALTDATQQARTAVIVYFIGGVIPGTDGELHLTTSSTDPRPAFLPTTAMPLSSLLVALQGAAAPRRALVIDGFGPATGTPVPVGRGDGIEVLLSWVASPGGLSGVSGAESAPLTSELVRILVNGDLASGNRLTLGGVDRRLVEVLDRRGGPRPTLVPATWSDTFVLALNPAHTPPVAQETPPTRVFADGPAPLAVIPAPIPAQPSAPSTRTPPDDEARSPAVQPAAVPPSRPESAPPTLRFPSAGPAGPVPPDGRSGLGSPGLGSPGPGNVGPGTATMPVQTEPLCPYPGLAAFDATSQQWFHGRERATADLVSRLATRLDGAGPLMLVAASGAGKSSLLRAGMLTALERGGLPGSGSWPQVLLTPTDRPIRELSRRTARALGMPPATSVLLEGAVTDPYRLTGMLTELLERSPGGRAGGRRLVIAVDQFEEIFTLCDDESERDAFVRGLCAAARGSGYGAPPAMVVLAVRADFFAACAAHPDLVDALQTGQFVVGPMTSDQVREAIVEPARKAGQSLEPGLVELMLRDLRAGPGGGDAVADPGSLPLLAHALRATWLAREGDTLTVAGYERAGGLTGAIAQTAEHMYAGLDVAGQRLAWPLLMRMVRVGESGDDTRRRVSQAELLTQVDDPDAPAVLDALVRARLVEVDADSVQIAHEALLRSWPRLREWIELDRAGALAWQQLTESSDVWDRNARDASYLISGSRLAVAREWVESGGRHAGLGATAQEFYAASLAREEAERRSATRRTRRLRVLVAVLTVLALLAAATTVVALKQRSSANHARDLALSQSIAARADKLRTLDPSLAAQLSLVAYDVADTPEARTSVLASGTVTRNLGAHTLPIGAVAYSPDGKLIASGSDDHSVALWDGADAHRRGPLARLAAGAVDGGDDVAVKSVAFSADSRTLATGRADGQVKLWDVSTPSDPRLLTALPAPSDNREVYALAFSPDGTILATGGDGTNVVLWDVTDPASPTRVGALVGHTKIVRAVAFTPDGNYAVTGAADGLAVVWDVTSPSAAHPVAPLIDPNAQPDEIHAVAVSPDGDSVVTGNQAGVVSHFDISNRMSPVPTRTNVAVGWPVSGLAYLDADKVIATIEADQAVILEPARSSSILTSLVLGWVTWSVAVSPTDGTIVIGAEDGVLRRTSWPGLVSSHGGNLVTGDMLSNRRVLATGDNQGQLSLWRIDEDYTTTELSAVRAHTPEQGFFRISISPDDRVLASTGFGGVVKLWDISDLGNPRLLSTISWPIYAGPAVPYSPPASGSTLPEPDQRRYSASFSPDGKLLALGGIDGDVTLWDVTDPASPQELAGNNTTHRDRTEIRRITFAPDGKLMASVGSDRVVILWEIGDAGTFTKVGEISGFDAKINDIDFAPTGRTLAAGGDERVVHLYDVTNPAQPSEITRLAPHNGAIFALGFSPDGHTLATGGPEIRLWDVTDIHNPRPRGDFLTGGSTWEILFTPDSANLVPILLQPSSGIANLDVDRQVAEVCDAIGDPITEEEWNRYLPDLTYDPPCD